MRFWDDRYAKLFSLAGRNCNWQVALEVTNALRCACQGGQQAVAEYLLDCCAVSNCKRAIQLDPDFGNPYNDIGVYLMQKGQFDEAIPWFERAKLAKRYEPRHFPYSNLASIYERKGRWREALREYREALRLEPHHQPALKAVARLRAQMN